MTIYHKLPTFVQFPQPVNKEPYFSNEIKITKITKQHSEINGCDRAVIPINECALPLLLLER